MSTKTNELSDEMLDEIIAELGEPASNTGKAFLALFTELRDQRRVLAIQSSLDLVDRLRRA